MDYFTGFIILILLGFLPWLLYFIYYSELKDTYLKYFIIGGVGWLVALFLRLPLLQISMLFLYNAILRGALAAILAGIFEEGFRYIFLLKSKIASEKIGSVVSFGIGWGIFEVWVVHSLALVSYILLISTGYHPSNIPSPDSLLVTGMAGVVERWVAVAAHVLFTLIVIKSLVTKNYIFLGVAVFFHALLDFVAVISLTFIGNLWLIEFTFFLLVLAYYIVAKTLLQIDVLRYFKKNERDVSLHEE